MIINLRIIFRGEKKFEEKKFEKIIQKDVILSIEIIDFINSC
jgi:c-di-GMP-related signal transduction protein